MRTLFIGIIAAALVSVSACTNSGGGSITAPSPVTGTPTVVGTQPTEAPCNGCNFSAIPSGAKLKLEWSGFFNGAKASCEITTVPNIGTYALTTCQEGSKLVDYPVAPTTFTLTVKKNEGEDPPQTKSVLFHGPVGTFAGPSTAATGHSGWLVVWFGPVNEAGVHRMEATWKSQVANDDDPGIVYSGAASGLDNSISANAISDSRCGGATGPHATFSATFTVVDGNHLTGTYTGSACSASSGTFTLERQLEAN